VLRPAGGLLLPPGDGAEQGLSLATFDTRYFYQLLDLLFRDAELPWRVGDQMHLQGLDIEVLETVDGRASAIRYRFDSPLEDAGRRWISWQGDRFVPFTVPAIGQGLTVPEVGPLLKGRRELPQVP
jgi:hypothetical protein